MDSLGIVLLLIGNAMGIILGAIGMYLLRGDSDKTETKDASSQKQTKDTPPAATLPEGYTELIRLIKKEDTGAIFPQINGKTFPTAAHLDETQRSQIIEIFAAFYKWFGGRESAKPPTSPKLASQPGAVNPPGQSQNDASVSEPPPTQPQQVYKPSSTPFADSLPEPVTLADTLRSNPFKRPKLKKDEEEKPLGMAEQIDKILQEKIKNTPLENYGISLKTLPGGSIIIMAKNQQFESIEAISDPEIKAAIQSAVSQWTRTQTPGASPTR